MTGIKVGLDFETYGSVNLKKYGLMRYVRDPHFQPLIAEAVVETPYGKERRSLDFVHGMDEARQQLAETISNNIVVAHNVPFEYAVLDWLGLAHLPSQYRDSAVNSRARGGGGSLAHAALQWTSLTKMEEGDSLIKLFSVPGKYQTEDEPGFNPLIVKDHPAEWNLFREYCFRDAEISLDLDRDLPLTLREQKYQEITLAMNMTGWPVDRDVVEEMYARYLENQMEALNAFRLNCNAPDLNLNSLPQQQQWCAERGIKARSFDEKSVEKLLRRIEKRAAAVGRGDPKYLGYCEVIEMLKTKQVLGGSSLKKLKVILDTITQDADGTWRLRDQYLHVGAGQTWRTTGRSVQMQNLKRIPNPRNMDTLFDPDEVWTNDDLAENLRQAFIASHPKGRLIVGDFSSIESRALAWQAGADAKVEAFRQGKDLYKVLASSMYHVPYNDVTKEQRQAGKVGELSCGYGAGPVAVQGFAAGMNIEMTEAEALQLVRDWRAANPEIVDFWDRLDKGLGLILSVGGGTHTMSIAEGWYYEMTLKASPASLLAIDPTVKTLQVRLMSRVTDKVYFTRYFHGIHKHGRNLRYYKPSKNKHGVLWKKNYHDPKTHQLRHYELYGGKLAGILTQSFCRELFFERLAEITKWVDTVENIQVIGQFHDEIVLDWQPPDDNIYDLDFAKSQLYLGMSQTPTFRTFPLDAEIKDDYRYTK